MFGVRRQGTGLGEYPNQPHSSTLPARRHLFNAGDGPDFVVSILPAVLQSRNEGELLLLEELVLLLDASEGLFHLVHCCPGVGAAEVYWEKEESFEALGARVSMQLWRETPSQRNAVSLLGGKGSRSWKLQACSRSFRLSTKSDPCLFTLPGQSLP